MNASLNACAGILPRLWDGICRKGGFTISREGSEPSAGYAVADGNDATRLVVTVDRFRARGCSILADWTARAGVREATARGAYLGGWCDARAGLVFLECSYVLPTREAALTRARSLAQRAIFDLAAGQTVYLEDATP